MIYILESSTLNKEDLKTKTDGGLQGLDKLKNEVSKGLKFKDYLFICIGIVLLISTR